MMTRYSDICALDGTNSQSWGVLQEQGSAADRLPGGHLKALGVGDRLPHAAALEALSYPARQLQPAPPQPPPASSCTYPAAAPS